MAKETVLEIFCGTGGVGKTTLAASRAAFLASKQEKVLLITIDPSHRLKQVLNLNNADSGEIEHSQIENGVEFDSMLLNPTQTLKRIAARENIKNIDENRILNVLMKPSAGMNEIMAVMELQNALQHMDYNTIILDTPPGSHFIDFLKASQKIIEFFDNQFIEIFNKLNTKVTEKNSRFKNLILNTTSKGMSKLLSYLEKVTGAFFVQEFTQAIQLIYELKSSFMESIHFYQNIKNNDSYQWYLVTSTEQQKIIEAGELVSQAQEVSKGKIVCLLNKCCSEQLSEWEPLNGDLSNLKDTMLERENKLKMFAKENFEKFLEFNESLSHKPLDQVQELSKQWNS